MAHLWLEMVVTHQRVSPTVQSMSPVQSPESMFCTNPVLVDSINLWTDIWTDTAMSDDHFQPYMSHRRVRQR